MATDLTDLPADAVPLQVIQTGTGPDLAVIPVPLLQRALAEAPSADARNLRAVLDGALHDVEPVPDWPEIRARVVAAIAEVDATIERETLKGRKRELEAWYETLSELRDCLGFRDSAQALAQVAALQVRLPRFGAKPPRMEALGPFATTAEGLERLVEDIADRAAGDEAQNLTGFPLEVAQRLGAGQEHPVKVLREWRGLTQAGLAEMAKTTRSTVAQIETGKTGLGANLRGRLAGALGVKPGDLVA